MATVLAAGGFPEEAPPLLAKALRHALAARLNASGEGEIDPALADLNQVRRLVKRGALSSEASHVLTALHPDAAKPTAVQATDLVQSTTRLIDALTANA
jgi:hypothetical protein